MRCICCEQEIKDEEIYRYYIERYPLPPLFFCERCGKIFRDEMVKAVETVLLRGEEIKERAEDRKKRELFKMLDEEGKRLIQEHKEKQHGQRQD